MKTYSKQRQKGRSMIEMLGVLAIVGVLSAGGIAGYSMAMQSYKTNQLIERIQLLATVARSTYKGNYQGISAANLIKAGKVSDITSPFGGNLVVRANGSSPGYAYFVVETPVGMPVDTCVDILQTDWGKEGVFMGVDMGSSTFRLADGTYPLDSSQAISKCKSLTSANDIEIWFK